MSCWPSLRRCRRVIGEGAARRVLPAPLHLIWRCALLLCSAPSMRARHSLKMYNGLVERCFMSCVDTFRRKTLEKNEEVVRVPHSSRPRAAFA